MVAIIDPGSKRPKSFSASPDASPDASPSASLDASLDASPRASLGALPAFRKGAEKAWLTEAGEMLEAASGAGKWITDFEAAKKMSKRTGKPMLVDFNGSDW